MMEIIDTIMVGLKIMLNVSLFGFIGAYLYVILKDRLNKRRNW